MKKLTYTKEENYWEAQVEFGDYYCTGKDGSGLFHIHDGNREQLLGTLQFSVAGLADSTAKRKLRDAVAADVGLEVARRLHHVAQYALRQKLVVEGTRHDLAVQFEGAV